MAVLAYLVLLLVAITGGDFEVAFAVFLAPVLYVAGAVPLRRMLANVEPDPWIRQAVMAGLMAKLLGGFARFYVNELVLGHADASAYYDVGVALSREFRQFVIGGPAYVAHLPNLTGTRFMRLVVGIVYIPLGESQMAGYLVFSFMSFWGLYLFYRAFSLAVPDGLRRRYVTFVFFLPSVVFWPSSIGKEAWMITMLGLGAYGLARLLAQRRMAYPLFLLALAAMVIVRPHVAALFGLGSAAAFVLRRTKGSGGAARKVLGLVVLALAAGLVANQLQSFFDLNDGLDPQQVLNETTRRSSQGGSQFQAINPRSPAQLPLAVVTVLFRPFLFEARGLPGLMTALEGTILLGMFLWNLPRLSRLPAKMVSRPYVGFALIYTLMFTFAFSAISNFGILARQRTQLFPIAVVILAVPYESVSSRDRSMARSRQRLPGHVGERVVVGGSAPGSPGRPGPGPGPGPAGDADDLEPQERRAATFAQARYIGRSAAARRAGAGHPAGPAGGAAFTEAR